MRMNLLENTKIIGLDLMDDWAFEKLAVLTNIAMNTEQLWYHSTVVACDIALNDVRKRIGE